VEGQEVNMDIRTITGVKSIRNRRINKLLFQEIANLHNFIKVLFAYSQEEKKQPVEKT